MWARPLACWLGARVERRDGSSGGTHPLVDDAAGVLAGLGVRQPPEAVSSDGGHDGIDAPGHVGAAGGGIVVGRVVEGMHARQYRVPDRHVVAVELLKRALGEHRARSDGVEPALLIAS